MSRGHIAAVAGCLYLVSPHQKNIQLACGCTSLTKKSTGSWRLWRGTPQHVNRLLGTSTRSAAVRQEVVGYVVKECRISSTGNWVRRRGLHSTTMRSRSTPTGWLPLQLGNAVRQQEVEYERLNPTDEQCSVGIQRENAQALRFELPICY